MANPSLSTSKLPTRPPRRAGAVRPVDSPYLTPQRLGEPAQQPPSTTTSCVHPCRGRVMSVMVRPGDAVFAGDEVCVVEAMKMEQSILAHRDGVVKTVFVQPLDSVSANDPLVELE